jgi:Tfp pilus assembly protein PilF/TolB-like protein
MISYHRFIYTASYKSRRASFPSLVCIVVFLLLSAGIPGCGKKDTTDQQPGEKTDERLSIAVIYFQNQTPDRETDWLGEGITHLVALDLSQSPRLNVLRASRLATILRFMGAQQGVQRDLASVIEVARRAGVEKTLFGSYSTEGTEISVAAQLVDVATGAVVREESISEQGDAALFTLADRLSAIVRDELDAREGQDRAVSDLTTHSYEAYQAYIRGVGALNAFHSPEGMVHLNQAVKTDTSFALAYAAMAIHTYGTGDLPRATSAVGRAMMHLDRLLKPEQLIVQAIEAHITEQFDHGFKYYHQLHETIDTGPDVHLILGQMYFAIGDFAAAEKVYQAILQQDPQHAIAHTMLGLTQLELDQADLAASAVLRSIQLQPDNPHSYIVLSRIYAHAGRPEDADLQLRKASQLDSKDPWVHNLLGYLYINQNKSELALKEFKRYAALAPDDPNAHDSLAEGYLRAGDKAMAEKEYLHALKLRPDFANPHYMLGLIYQDRGETQKAGQMYQKYLQLSPRGPLAGSAEEKLEELGAW